MEMFTSTLFDDEGNVLEETSRPYTQEELEEIRIDGLRDTDKGMARVTEDVAVAMITGEPLPQAAIDKINVRRRLRGEPDV